MKNRPYLIFIFFLMFAIRPVFPKAPEKLTVVFQSISPNKKFKLTQFKKTIREGNEIVREESIICVGGSYVSDNPNYLNPGDGLGHLDVSVTAWTKDSRYCIFSAYHENGHQVWNTPIFVAEPEEDYIFGVESVVNGAVRKPYFELSDQGIIKMIIRPDGGKEDAENIVEVSINDIVKKDRIFPPMPKLEEYKNEFQSDSPDHSRRLVEINRPWRSGNSNLESVILLETGVVTLDLRKRFDATENLILSGMGVVKALWSVDGKYCIFSCSSPNGHSPWHFPIFVLDVVSRKALPVEPWTGAIVKAEFELRGDGTLEVFAAGIDPSDGSMDTDKSVMKSVTIAEVLKGR